MKLLPFLRLLLSPLQIAKTEVVFIVLIEFYLKHVVEEVIFFSRLGDSRAFLQVACLVYTVRHCRLYNLFSKGDDRTTCFSIKAVSEVPEGALRDLHIATDEVGRKPRLKLHELSLKGDIIEALFKQVFTQYRLLA